MNDYTGYADKPIFIRLVLSLVKNPREILAGIKIPENQDIRSLMAIMGRKLLFIKPKGPGDWQVKKREKRRKRKQE